MKPIGGYFELELVKGNEYYPDLIRLNSGRNAFEVILRTRGYKKVLLPYYTCDAMFEPIKRLGVACEFYQINAQLEPVRGFAFLKDHEVAVYNNYFGVKDKFIQQLRHLGKNIIIDNCQAFYSKPTGMFDTFYSPRKFFGVPDGGYLYMSEEDSDRINFEKDHSYDHFAHLIKRVDLSPEDAYDDFLKAEQSLVNRPVKTMSDLTGKILQSVNYQKAFEIRQQNFNYLHQRLKDKNLLEIDSIYDLSGAPMVYPFLSDHSKLREFLISKKVYVATYWPNVLDWVAYDSIEYIFAQNLIPLPVDQRYSLKEMEKIIHLINEVVRKSKKKSSF